MTISVLAAARRLCETSGWKLSNLELQKILYLSHMIWLGRHEGKIPLIKEYFEAWDYGPVVPTLYHAAKVFGSSPVRNVFHGARDELSAEHKAGLDEAIRGTEGLRPGQLVAITHWEKGAWAKNYRPGASRSLIANQDIYEEYKERLSATGK